MADCVLDDVDGLTIHSVAFSGTIEPYSSIPVGRSIVEDGRVCRLQQDQCFVICEEGVDLEMPSPVFVTDQSDGWVALRLAGRGAIQALERICMLDLGSERMTPGASVRTLMEHLTVILIREDETSFLLLSARSSARSFRHTLEVSVRNIV